MVNAERAWGFPGWPEPVPLGWAKELSNNSEAPVLWNLLPGNRETGTCIPRERTKYLGQTKQ